MTFRTTSVMTMFVLLGLTVSPAMAGMTRTYEKTTLAGQEIFLFGGSTLNPDCSKAGKDDLRATSGPSHGRLRIVYGKTYSHYSKKDQRSSCNSRKVDGIKVLYRSNPGFKGWDKVTLAVHTYFGRASNAVINIKVE